MKASGRVLVVFTIPVVHADPFVPVPVASRFGRLCGREAGQSGGSGKQDFHHVFFPRLSSYQNAARPTKPFHPNQQSGPPGIHVLPQRAGAGCADRRLQPFASLSGICRAGRVARLAA
jgi:hypothetical protein